MNKVIGLMAIATAIGLFALSRRNQKPKNVIDPTINTYQDREQYIPQQKSDVLDPMSMNATNIPIINSTPVNIEQGAPVSLYKSPRLS
ncbi:hypothetical protein [Candidatus Magnetobacterium casense]|uniref:Secreted protein n=1 Tax=Candidatus Magnetobacterium casense TaxID=1455061 RepID=A0ABS6RUR0_9BACT|nr:hypothetical protein [Candidatus Magnetobacterium casensis]MBV6340362.1 hypothetical protein [Candidatus Magnetobacterium casensis]